MEHPKICKKIFTSLYMGPFSIAVLFTTITFQASASFIGDTINADLTNNHGPTTTNFGTGVVGDGVDLTGQFTTSFDLIWDFTLDVAESGFTLGVLEQTRAGNGNLTHPYRLFSISLSDLDWNGLPSEIVGVTMTDYTCMSSGISCTAIAEGPRVRDISFDSDSLRVEFDTLRHGEQYTFDIEVTPVPIPAAVWLFGTGLIGLIGTARRKKHKD